MSLVCRACGAPIGPDDEYWVDRHGHAFCLDCGAERLYAVAG
ncbi:MAG TPA: hypothetical protein VFL91_30345 [Thermomicrobiales bacterium]|nr:hypothetical protein [Thermomicrobiales bacterium]